MVLVGSGSVSFDTDPDSGSSHFLYGSGSSEMIRIPRIRIRHTGVVDPNTLNLDPNTLNLDPDPGFWLNLDLDPGFWFNLDLDPDPGITINFEEI